MQVTSTIGSSEQTNTLNDTLVPEVGMFEGSRLLLSVALMAGMMGGI